jgi:hypothetical protein
METVTISTVEYFNSNNCNHPQLHKLNTFNKTSMEWNLELRNYEKYMQYNGCELVMMLPTPYPDQSLYHVSGYSLVNDDSTNFEVRGITPKVFEIAAKNHNFTAGYQPVFLGTKWLQSDDGSQDFSFWRINNTRKIPHVYFQVMTIHHSRHGLPTSNVIENLKFKMFVTPAEKYTPYEKFVLPFDLLTWILIAVTFIATFSSIIIINCLSRTTQNIVYGHKVDAPVWNVVCIFFGISQTQLPTANFPRFILVIFIYFCLIFRTCFQSKFFEFMTSEPRRSPPKTLQDVFDRQYGIYQMSTNGEQSSKDFYLGPR